MRRLVWHLAGIVITGLVILAAVRTGVAAESRQARQDQDVLPALLTEVRGLRAAMEQMATAGPRVQLAMGRLQLQEQRINTLVRRQDELRSEAQSLQDTIEQERQQIAMLEGAEREPGAPPDEKHPGGDVFKMLSSKVARGEAEVLRLQSEEASVTQQIATEQGRWSDFNRGLEELERALARK